LELWILNIQMQAHSPLHFLIGCLTGSGLLPATLLLLLPLIENLQQIKIF